MRKAALLLVLAVLPLMAATPLPPKPAKYVTDNANVLDDAREHALNERLAEVDRETTNQVIVYVDRKLPEGTTLEEMGAAAVHAWAPGQKGKDNGVILFLFLDDRKSRIEVGYGLEGELTDAKSKDILVSLRPALRAGDVTTAVEQGVDQILGIIGVPAPPADAVQQPVAAAVAPRRYHEEETDRWQMLPAALLLLGLIVLIIAIARKARGIVTAGPSNDDGSIRSTPMWDSSSSSSSSSFDSSSDSSSSDSSSDFSGGGGDGGGGGSSDSW